MAKKATKKPTKKPTEKPADDLDDRCIKALTHNGRPKSFCHRLTEAERKQLADVWEKHAPPDPGFNAAMDAFWAERAERLYQAKATDDVTEPPPPAEPSPSN